MFAELHPFLAHFSVALLPAGILVPIIYRFAHQEWLLKASFSLFVLSSVALLLSYFSGGAVEELVEKIPGVKGAIEEHEQWGTIAKWSVFSLTVLTFLYMQFKDSLLRFNQDASYYVVLVVGLWASVAVILTGRLGGDLVYDYAVAGAVRKPSAESIQRQMNAYFYTKLEYLKEKNDIPAIYSLFREIEVQLPDNTDFRIMQAEFLFQQLNNPTEALNIIKQVKELLKDPQSRQYHDALVAEYKAYVALADQDGQTAVKKRLAELFPDSPYLKTISR